MESFEMTVLPISPVLVRNLVTLAKTFADLEGVKITTVGTNSTKTASFYVDLESGETSCTLRKYDLLTKWFASNWPDGHEMPTLEDTKHYPNNEVGITVADARRLARKASSVCVHFHLDDSRRTNCVVLKRGEFIKSIKHQPDDSLMPCKLYAPDDNPDEMWLQIGN
jgi:hypothetical protein